MTLLNISAHTILVRARELIAEPKNWTQGVMARDRTGDATLPGDKHATCFCTAGAVYRAEIDAWREGYGTPVERVVASSGATFAIAKAIEAREFGDNVSIVTFNDRPTTTHADVLQIFDAAIAAEAARP